jgi:hypothetical protein
MKINRENRIEEMNAYGAIILAGALSLVFIGVLLCALFNLF